MKWFAIEFTYPDPTPEGHSVERKDEDRGDSQRVHLSSPSSGELYFEVSRFTGLAPRDEFERHRPYIEERFGDGAVTELDETTFAGQPAWRYAFRWDDGERAVVSVDLSGDTYRFLYDPTSLLNEEILSTVIVRGQD